MSQPNVSSQIGQAWNYHRQGNNKEAIAEFESAIRTAPENVDAYYGLGLAQRAAGDQLAASDSFSKAHSLAKTRLAALHSGESVGNDLQSSEDDRYLMLVRMIGQRLAEMGAGITDAQS